MKSTVLTAVLFLSATLTAQVSNEIRDPQVNNNVVTGQTLNFYLAPGVSHAYHLDAFNISGQTKTFKVLKQDVVMMTDAYTWFCIYHNGDGGDLQSHCYTPGFSTPVDVFVTDSGHYNQFICDFFSGTAFGTSIVNYYIFDPNNSTDTAMFTLQYNVSPASVSTLYGNGVVLGEAYPNPSNGVVKFNFNLGEIAGATMNVYDAQGRIVRTEAIVRREGELSLDLAGLPAGIYSCVLSADGVAVTRRVLLAE